MLPTKRPKAYSTFIVSVVVTISATSLTSFFLHRRQSNSSQPVRAASARVPSTPAFPAQVVSKPYNKLPLTFEENKGQVDRQVKFLSRSDSSDFFLTPSETVLVLRKTPKCPLTKDLSTEFPHFCAQGTDEHPAILRTKFRNANPGVRIQGSDERLGKSNYFIGNHPSKWLTDITHYAKVQYKEIYPGVDLVYYGNRNRLEYDFVVAAGANTKNIQLSFAGADRVRLDDIGDMILNISGKELRYSKPTIYQVKDGQRKEVFGGYEIRGKHEVGFALRDYDKSLPLTIDPTLDFSTYLGGNGADESYGIAVDQLGNTYISGLTYSTNFPVPNALQDHANGYPSAFITKVNAAGSAILYSTYVGGSSGFNASYGIAIDSAGSAYVTGLTQSADFPTVNPIQPGLRGDTDGFVLKLNSLGNGLSYSTYLGGSGGEYCTGIAVDSSAEAYLIGFTASTDFPTSNAFQNINHGNYDVFITKLNSSGDAFVYSTYLGGSDRDIGNTIAVDGSGSLYVAGETASVDFPTLNSLQTYIPPYSDAFVTKLNPEGNAILYSSFLGGSKHDIANAIAVDSTGKAYITGRTESDDFPLTNPSQGTRGGSADCFVTALNSTGAGLIYSTYLGGSSDDYGYGIAVDSAGSAYVAGYTSSINFPTASALQPIFGGGLADAFISKLNASGGALVYSTYLGSNQQYDYATAIAVNSTSAYVTGVTDSNTFPTANPMQPVSGGSRDVFISRIRNANSTLEEIVPYQSSGYRYQIIASDATPPVGFEQPAYDDSGWGVGSAAFGVGVGFCPLQATDHAPWPVSTDLLVRRSVEIPDGATNVRIAVAVDNDIVNVFFNGVSIAANLIHGECPQLDDFQIEVPQNLVVTGSNVVAYHLRDRGFESFFDTRIVATIGPLPTPTPTPSPSPSASPCIIAECTAGAPSQSRINLPIEFQASVTTDCFDSAIYDWDFGDGSPHGSQADSIHVYTATGRYTWTMSVRFPGSVECVKSEEIQIGGSCAVTDSSPADILTRLIPDENDTLPIGNRTPVILIHGIHGNKPPNGTDDIAHPFRNYFRSLLGYFDTEQFKSRYKIYRFHFVSDQYSVAELARALRNAVDSEICLDPSFDQPFIILAHSLGGLVARSYMNQYNENVGYYAGLPVGARVIRLITLATPHHGTPGANAQSRDDLATFGWGGMLDLASAYYWGFRIPDGQLVPTLAYNKPNRSNLLWDNFDGIVSSANSDLNVWLFHLNEQEQFSSKIIAYYGYFKLDDKQREQLVTYYGADRKKVRFDRMLTDAFFADKYDDDHAKAAIANIVIDYGMRRFFSLNDGLVPVESGAFRGTSLAARIACGGFDHLDMKEGGKRKCNNGLTLFANINRDLGF